MVIRKFKTEIFVKKDNLTFLYVPCCYSKSAQMYFKNYFIQEYQKILIHAFT